jgi:hypothetical protein
MTTTDENCLRRLAVQLAAQLPDSSDDALVTIGYLRELVDFVAAPDQAAELAYEQQENVTSAPGTSAAKLSQPCARRLALFDLRAAWPRLGGDER